MKPRASPAATLLVLTVACVSATPSGSTSAGAPASAMVGEFEDEYGNRHRISASQWLQYPDTRFRVTKWRTSELYLVALSDSSNRMDAGRWTRIDWEPMRPPWSFMFCITYVPSPGAADSTHHAERSTLRTGCNGLPFLRMRRVPHPDR